MSDTPADPDAQTRIELEAAAFRTLLAHLEARSDVANIALMNLAGFCRNCLANWYLDAATQLGLPLTKEQSREAIYGMSYEAWKALHQSEASPEQKAAFARSQGERH